MGGDCRRHGRWERLQKTVALAMAVVLFSGCATVIKGSNEVVSFTSEPPGATVYLYGQPLGTTPMSVGLESKNTYSIEFQKEGFQPRTVFIGHSVGAGWLLLDVLFLLFLVPIVMDAVTGDWYYLEPSSVHVPLVPKAPVPQLPFPPRAPPAPVPGT